MRPLQRTALPLICFALACCVAVCAFYAGGGAVCAVSAAEPTVFPDGGDWYYSPDYLNIGAAADTVDGLIASGVFDMSAVGDPIVIAVIDTGVNDAHEIFGGEEYGDVLLRDGSGGVIGYNSAAESRNYADDSSDGHGTHVAGIVASLIHAFGLEEYVKIMPVKASKKSLSGKSSFSKENVEKAVDFALANGADIVNMSLATDSSSWEDVIAADDTERAVFVAAAGNHSGLFQNGYDSDKKKFYPAACENVVGVMNYESAESGGAALKSSSNYGSAYDVCAPGTDILSADAATVDGYKTLSGTSMASPVVAFAAALLQLRFTAETGCAVAPDADSVASAFTKHYTSVLTKNGREYPLLDLNTLIGCEYAYGGDGEVYPLPESTDIVRSDGEGETEYVFTAAVESPVLWDGYGYEWVIAADGDEEISEGKILTADFSGASGDITVILNVYCAGGELPVASATETIRVGGAEQKPPQPEYGGYDDGLAVVVALWISVGVVVALTVILCRIAASSR